MPGMIYCWFSMYSSSIYDSIICREREDRTCTHVHPQKIMFRPYTFVFVSWCCGFYIQQYAWSTIAMLHNAPTTWWEVRDTVVQVSYHITLYCYCCASSGEELNEERTGRLLRTTAVRCVFAVSATHHGTNLVLVCHVIAILSLLVSRQSGASRFHSLRILTPWLLAVCPVVSICFRCFPMIYIYDTYSVHACVLLLAQ